MRSITLAVLVLALPFVAGATLADYPRYFFDGDNFTADIVLGNDAPALDTVTATNTIATPLQARTDQRIKASALDRNIDLQRAGDLIVVGCENSITEQLTGKTCSDFQHPTLLLYEQDGYQRLVVTGGTAEQTQAAGQVIQDPNNPDLRGTALQVNDGLQETNLPTPGTNGPVNDTVVNETIEDEPAVENETPEVADTDDVSNVVNETGASDGSTDEPDVETTSDDELRDNNLSETIEELQEEPNVTDETNVSENDTEQTEEVSDEPIVRRAWTGFKNWLGWFFKPR